jgi:hypothetical protein
MSLFLFQFPPSASKYNFVTVGLHALIGKHIFLDSKHGILFCGRYYYKFNNVVIVTHFTGSCMSVTGASYCQTLRKSGARRESSTMDLCFLLDSIPVHKKRPPRVDGGSVNFVCFS